MGSFVVFEAGIKFGLIPQGTGETILLWLFVLLPAFFIVTTFVGAKVRNKILNIFYTLSATWLAMLLWLFIGAVLLSLYMAIARLMGFEPAMYLPALLVSLLVGVTLVYGIVHARKIKTTEYEITSLPLSQNWKGKKIVFVSDLHLGMVRSKNFTERVVEKINTFSPDIVFIPGDIIDGPSFDYAHAFAPLQNIKTVHGTYFTHGNHEKFNKEPHIWEPILKSHVVVLADQMVEVNGTQIIGLDYIHRSEKFEATKSRLLKTGYEKEKPSIVMLHDPKNNPALAELGTSLVLSGHTHLGQFWPIDLLVRRIYKKLAYGMLTINQTISITSSGIGTAVSPVRLGTKAEIVVIKIK